MWWLLLTHFVADWALQSDYMASHKRESYTVLLAHCCVYAFVVGGLMALLGRPEWWRSASLLVTHGILDVIKMRQEEKGDDPWIMPCDQLAHLLIIALVWWPKRGM
jgi:hypothetical protein